MKNVLTTIKETMLMIFFSYSSCAFSSEDVVLLKYRLGYPYSNEGRRDKAIVDPLPGTNLTVDGKINHIEPYYSISDEQSGQQQKRHQLYVHLTVQQKKQTVIATVKFDNQSDHPFYVHKSRLAMQHIGQDSLYEHAFLIASEGIFSFFIGHRWHFDDETNESKTGWEKIQANGTYSFTVTLNDTYSFLPGKRRYNIGSLEYSVVNEQWFVDSSTYESLFSILDWTYLNCHIPEGIYYMRKINNLCTSNYWNRNQRVRSFLYNLNFLGFDDNNYFEIRTNQVVISLDGDKLTSPYDKKK